MAVRHGAPAPCDTGIDHAGNDTRKALSARAYHEATETVRASAFGRRGESETADYDSRRTVDRLSDTSSTLVYSICGRYPNQRMPPLFIHSTSTASVAETKRNPDGIGIKKEIIYGYTENPCSR